MFCGVEVMNRKSRERRGNMAIIGRFEMVTQMVEDGSGLASPTKAVCLLSGGLDSATCLALARREGYCCYALSFDYGQRHKIELEAASRVAASIGVERHLVAKIGLDVFGG